jgi:hypothetical protein
MKSLSSILKSALEAKNASKPEKTKGRKKKTEGKVSSTSTSAVVTPKKTKRSTRGG